jgi:hypothetical protein
MAGYGISPEKKVVGIFIFLVVNGAETDWFFSLSFHKDQRRTIERTFILGSFIGILYHVGGPFLLSSLWERGSGLS